VPVGIQGLNPGLDSLHRNSNGIGCIGPKQHANLRVRVLCHPAGICAIDPNAVFHQSRWHMSRHIWATSYRPCLAYTLARPVHNSAAPPAFASSAAIWASSRQSGPSDVFRRSALSLSLSVLNVSARCRHNSGLFIRGHVPVIEQRARPPLQGISISVSNFHHNSGKFCCLSTGGIRRLVTDEKPEPTKCRRQDSDCYQCLNHI
jgi:hypothetical protein